MADFDPPFSTVGGVRRSPSTDEQSDGFQCGAADLELFNRLFGRIESELHAVQVAGGITGTENDDTSVLQAILALINAATGGGATADYVLFTQAQTRLPILPEVQTADGKIAVTSTGAGNVRIPAAVSILHRGIRPYSTALTDLVTVASKVYHLRWQVSAGVGTFVLKDIADTGYNPTVADESNAAFDSTYDDMLVARVITNSSNVANITNLVNLNRLRAQKAATGAGTRPGGDIVLYSNTFSLDWARTPVVQVTGSIEYATSSSTPTGSNTIINEMTINSQSRYSVAATLRNDLNFNPNGSVTGKMSLMAIG